MNLRNGRLTRVFPLCQLTLISALALTGCRPHDFPQYTANYREYAYVTNGDSGTVSVLDVVNVRLDREIAVGQNPVAVAASSTRNEAYVVNQGAADGNGSLSVIDTGNNSVAATIGLHHKPVSIDLDPGGDLAYVANSGSNTISIVDLKARREVTIIGAGEEPVEARVSPDGRTLVVPNRTGNSVTVLDAAARPPARSVRAVFVGCPGASDAVILPDSSKAFVACSGGHQLMAILLARPAGNPPLPDRLEAILDVGRAPMQLALKPDGGELFVSNSLSDSISEVVTGTDDVGGAYMIGDDPVRGLVSNNNALLYVSDHHSTYVTVYSIDDGRRIPDAQGGSIHVGDGPSAMAFSAAGHLLFVVDTRSADVSVVLTASRSLFTVLPTGRGPNAIAVKAFRAP
jgi:YVTN family beta-propeller protein